MWELLLKLGEAVHVLCRVRLPGSEMCACAGGPRFHWLQQAAGHTLVCWAVLSAAADQALPTAFSGQGRKRCPVTPLPAQTISIKGRSLTNLISKK